MTVRNSLTVGAVLTAMALVAGVHGAHATTVTTSYATFAASYGSVAQTTNQGFEPIGSTVAPSGGTTSSIPLFSGNSISIGSTGTQVLTVETLGSGVNQWNGTSFGIAGVGYTGEVFVDATGSGLIVINLATPETNFGFFVENSSSGTLTRKFTVTAYPNTNLGGTANVSSGSVQGSNTSSTFVGFMGTPLISSISIAYNNTTGNTFAIGDFVEGTVPEPASLVILGSGLLGLGIARRRRSKV